MYLSTTTLAKEKGLEPQELFKQLKIKGWIEIKEHGWRLTKEGEMAGGKVAYNPKFGEYITWPSNLNLSQEINYEETLSSTKIGEEFNIPAQKINKVFEDLGWIEKVGKLGWKPTKQGKFLQAYKLTSQKGISYVVWDKSILTNKNFLKAISFATGEIYKTSNGENENTEKLSAEEFRKKFEAKYRTNDGHRVRSKAEAIIDNYLYGNNIVHAYEKRLPIDEDVISDFYVKEKQIYIEYWGLEDDPKYIERKNKKKEIYAKYGYHLIELNEKDLECIDDILPRKLRKFGIQI